MNQKLLLIALSGLSLTTLADEARLLRFPATNGKEIVFSYAGDLYQVPMSGGCLLYTSPSPRDTERSRMPSSA